jgi:hypothetical protein
MHGQTLEANTMLIPLLVVGGAGVVLLALLVWGRRLFTGTRLIDESFSCAWKHRPVDISLRMDAWDGRRVDVEQCTAFTPPTAIGCDKRCLDREALRSTTE